MKKLLTILFLFAAITNLSAEIAVKSFRKLETDMTARIDAKKIDQNGDVCAIIKVVTTQTGFIWEPDGLGIISAENKGGEFWLYVPYGAKRLTIKHPQLGVLRDFMYNMPIEKASVYEMILTTGKVITTVEETIESQWLVITPEPNDATVYLDEVFVKSGMYQAKLKPGSYTYRIEAPLYHTEAGKVEITDAKKEITAKLKPASGYVSVTTSPEKDAKVIIDGKTLTTNTPCKSEALASGEHTVQVIKEMYQPTAQKVTVTDGQMTSINFTMQPNFAEVTISAPTNATLYVNNEKKSTGNWNGRLNAGVYSLEARLDKHRTAKQDIEVTAGDKKTIDLQPSPIYGSLDVVSTPAGASISINGKEYGTTPNTVSKLLIGEYEVVLSKVGFGSVKKKITLNEGKSNEIAEFLIKGRNDSLQTSKTSYTHDSVMNINSNDEQTLMKLIKIYISEKKYKQVILICERGIRQLPNLPTWYYYKGIAHYQLAEYRNALVSYKTALPLISNEQLALKSDFVAQIADIYYKLQMKDSAFVNYDASLVANPKNIMVMNNYAYYLSLEKAELQKAEKMSAKTVELEPKNSTFLDTYAWILYQRGNYSLAKFYIEKAFDNLPKEEDHSLILDHYGDILWKNGNAEGNDVAKALEMWEKAFVSNNKNDLLRLKIEKLKKR